MDLKEKNGGLITPSKTQKPSKNSENVNPNVISPVMIKSAKTQKSFSKNLMASPTNKIKERRFVVAKRNNSKKEKVVTCNKCKENGVRKCLCLAYESLRASQEEFFKKGGEEKKSERGGELNEGSENGDVYEENEEKENDQDLDEVEEGKELEEMKEMGSSTMKRRRDKLLEEARKSIPEPGSGRVMHLVKAFERLLSIPPSAEDDDENGEKESEESSNNNDDDNVLIRGKEVTKWALPGLQQQQPKAHEMRESMSSFCPSDLFLTSENLGLDSRLASSWDSSQGSFSISNRTSGGGLRSRRNSTESSGAIGGSRWKKKQLRITNQKPFKLRTEQRGRMKEEELMKKIQKMMEEQERLRIPIAQGLPWTTDEPECLVKPPVKENTRPVDLKLHSDMRAVERAEFDEKVAEKMSLIEQYKMERERQQKLAEEEEIRRLRKELVPRAQPMPYFDRPFIPRRSMKNPTIPKEPKFHMPQHKKIKCCLSWTDMSEYAYHQ